MRPEKVVVFGSTFLEGTSVFFGKMWPEKAVVFGSAFLAGASFLGKSSFCIPRINQKR